jgi:hypothetical protein
MKRPLSREELEDMDFSPTQIAKILEKQSKKKERKYKYIVLLTTKEAEELSKKTGKGFIRASEWKEWRNKKSENV